MAAGNVLLIECDDDRRRALRCALERRGFTVVGEASSVPDVVHAAAGLGAVPNTIMVGASLGPDAPRIAKLSKRTWPKANVIEELPTAAVGEAPVKLRRAAGA